jgi:predicted patatin/cPLA2 family phospholipase
MCYYRIPNELNPYDYDEFNKFDGEFYAVVTNCITGQAEYLRVTDLRSQIDYIRASCSLPLIAEMVNIGGVPYLDGGIGDSIPVRRSVRDGNAKNVIILTRDITYRKKPNELLSVIKVKYSKYPKLVEAIAKRHELYNMTLDYIKKQEEKGNVLVIRPSTPVKVGKIEKDKKKLTALYKLGYKDAAKKYDELSEFIEKI